VSDYWSAVLVALVNLVGIVTYSIDMPYLLLILHPPLSFNPYLYPLTHIDNITELHHTIFPVTFTL